MEKKEPVEPTTLFELGSTSKAFTGLGILQLEKNGKLKLGDPVKNYIPWLKMKFRGKEVQTTIAHFLYQTSGIPFETIGDIPALDEDDDNALEKTVRMLVGRELRHAPGTEFLYATINYDVLGLIIQNVSGESFEEYMRENILMPLQLNHTFLFRSEAESKDMATGYKLCFKKPAAYDAPVYRGNTPAGYFITNAQDLGQWLKIQMGTIELTGFDKELIEKSHMTDPDRPESDYAAGWIVLKNIGQIAHSGANPNFSSFVAFAPEEKVGVAVLANSNSNFTTGTGQGIAAILRGMEPKPSFYDMNARFDDISFKIVLILAPFILLALVLFLRSIIIIVGKKRPFSARGIKRVVGFIVATVLMVGLCYVLFIIPSLLNYNVPLSFAVVWMPMSFTYAVLSIFLTGFLFYLFFLSKLFFPKTSIG
jgi:CubicO group peptidase (beta-lactamase class C family)